MEVTPLELLEAELAKWQKALDKSKKTFDEGGIRLVDHETHKANLEPKIAKYKYAIRILETYM
jgi:hypothetical protein